MRIVSFDEFVKLPPGTIFSYYEPMVLRGLYRKGESINGTSESPTDYFECSIIPDCGEFSDCMLVAGGQSVHPSPAVEMIEGRWGTFDNEQLYGVYDEPDVEKIIEILQSKP